MPDNPGCQVPSGFKQWSWRRLRRVQGLRERAVVLTLDVGAKLPTLELVLDVLKAQAVPSTIFLYTQELMRAQRGAELVKRMLADGHELANHTLSHKDLTKLDPEQAAEELDAVERWVHETTGTSSMPFFREPFLATNDAVDRLVKERCYRSIWFTVDTADWKEGATAQGIEDSVFMHRGEEREILPGSIFIFHGSQKENVRALPRVIERLRQRGFSFLTLGEALRRSSSE